MNPSDEYVATTSGADQNAADRADGSAVVDPQQKSESGLERVLDVPLTVMLRFGERRMRLQDVLALSAGSLVSLDRLVEDPVELLLGDRILARGEVLIVDGNYGLRVTEVVDTPRVAEL